MSTASDSIILLGQGPSAELYDWDAMDVPIMAVSGGYKFAPDITHFCTLDRPVCFPEWLQSSENFTKHIAGNKFAKRWSKYPRVRAWEYIDSRDVQFGPDGPIVGGPLPRNYSLFFAVQLAARLGYERLIFVGCDLLENELRPINNVMREWWPLAVEAGQEWVNASPLSTFCEWMPEAKQVERLEV